MKNELIRRLLGLLLSPGQASTLLGRAVTVVIGLAGFGLATGHSFITLHHVEKFLQVVISLIGCAVVANIMHRHFNELLKYLLDERRKGASEARHTTELLKQFFDTKDPGKDSKSPTSTSDPSMDVGQASNSATEENQVH